MYTRIHRAVAQQLSNTLRHLLLVVSLAVLCTACHKKDSSPASSEGAAKSDLVARYGYGPQPDPSVTYQPDVFLIGTGPAAIRGVSSDGLTWRLDPRAPGVDQLSIGKVMFASSVAVGRVLKRESKGSVVEVTLAPVSLGEVVRDAHIVLDQTVPLDSLTIADIPLLAGGYVDTPSNALTSDARYLDGPTLQAPTLVLAMARAFASAGDAPSAGNDVDSKSKDLNGWTLTAYRGTGVLGLRAERGITSAKPVEGADLKVAIDAHIEVPSLHVVADIPVTRGEVGTSHFRVFGIDGLSITVQAGAVNGLSDNRTAKIEIPLELRQPVIIGGFPAMLTQKFKFLVQTAFTAKNGNLAAHAEWDVDGSLGIDGSTVSIPTMTAREGKRLIDNVAGISIGVNGIVVAVSFDFGLMIGLPVAGAGPTASFITSLGITNGSGIGLLRGELTCRQVSITSVITAGVAVQTFDPVKKALKALIGYEVPESKTVMTENILQEKWVRPNVVACR